MSEEPRKKLGQYELTDIIGRGGMATVWRAYQSSLDRYVAIKLMAAQFSNDESFAKRFNQEARSIAKLRHTNILAVYEYGQEEGQPYIVTELLEGGTLREFMRKPLELKQMARIIGQIADALDYAHSQHMVHRDIKPSNILMGTQRVAGDRAVLADFGIVKVLADTKMTQTGVGIGTAEYMSPEQAAGETLDGRSDEYSLGIVLYEMLTGVTPYKADEPLAIMMGHVNKPLPDPRTFNPKIPAEVVEVLRKVLAKYPNERYNSVGDFAEALQQAVALSSATHGQPAQPGVHLTAPQIPPANPLTGTGTRPFFISSAQAYDYALRQEEEGNRQAAFETLTDINRRESSYRDVATRIKKYEDEKFQYTGKVTLYRPPEPDNEEAPTESLYLKIPVVEAPTGQVDYKPADPTVSQPPIKISPQTALDQPVVKLDSVDDVGTVGNKTGQKSPNIGLLAGIAGGILALVIIAVVAIVSLGGGTKTPTPTIQAAVPTTVSSTSAATSPATITRGNTDITAIPPIVATPTPTQKPDPVGKRVDEITNDIYSNGNLIAGINELKDLATANPTSWKAQRELGRAYYWHVRNPGGKQFLEKAAELNPDDALTQAYLAIAYFDTFDDTKALATSSKAVSLDNKLPEVRAAAALTLVGTDPRRALNEIQQILTSSEPNILTSWAAYGIFMQNTEYGSALKQIDDLIAKYPKFAVFRTGKGYLRSLQSDDLEAEKLFKEALTIDRDFPRAHAGLATIARSKNQFDDAIKGYQAAITGYKFDPTFFVGLGYALDAKGLSEQAATEFRNALALNNKSAEAYNGLAFTYISRSLQAGVGSPSGKDFLSEAINNANQATTLSKNYADAYFQRGYALYLLERWSDAEEPLAKAIELRKDASYYAVQGYNFYKLGKKPEAKQAAEAALTINPGLNEARELLKALGVG